MRELYLLVVIPLAFASLLAADTCTEVVRDDSGRIVQTIERVKGPSGTVQATTRDTSGRITGTAVSQPNKGGSRTDYRDASGRLTAPAATQASAHRNRQVRDGSHVA